MWSWLRRGLFWRSRIRDAIGIYCQVTNENIYITIEPGKYVCWDNEKVLAEGVTIGELLRHLDGAYFWENID